MNSRRLTFIAHIKTVSFLYLNFYCISTVFANTNKQIQPVKTKNGLNDTETVIGKLFIYSIKDTFEGDVQNYTVEEAGYPGKLPDWLLWDEDSLSFLGVPGEQDRGWYHVSVAAQGYPFNETHSSYAIQVFSIKVRHEASLRNESLYKEQDAYFFSDQSPPRCPPNEPLILLIFFPDFLFSPKISPHLSSKLEKIEAFHETTSFLPFFDQSRIRLLNSSYILSFLDFQILYPELPPSLQQIADQSQNFLEIFDKSMTITLILGCGDWISSKKDDILSIADKFSTQLISNSEKAKFQIIRAKMLPPERRRRALQVQSKFDQPFTTQETEPPSEVTTPRPSTTKTRPKTTRFRSKSPSTSSQRVTSGTRRTSRPSTRFTAAPTTETTKMLTTAGASSSVTSSTKKLVAPVDTSSTRAGPKFAFGIGHFTCTKGVVCEKELGKYIVYDKEDGTADRLSLQLALTKVEDGAPAVNWLSVNSTGPKLVGLPLNIGKYHYRLAATNSAGKRDSSAFEVSVESKYDPEDHVPFTHQFLLSLNLDYEQFNKDSEKQLLFVQRLSLALDDSNSSHIFINSIKSGSTLIAWSNLTLSTTECANDQVLYLLRRQQQQSFKDRLGIEFPFKSVILERLGACAETTTIEPLATTVSGRKDDDNFFLATILPAIIIFLLLFIAILVACLLYRRGKNAKSASIDDSKSEFITKGTPVIFPDEIDVEKETTAAAPMLLKDEKPPLQPMSASLPGVDFPPPSNVNDSTNAYGFGGHVTRNGMGANQYAPGSYQPTGGGYQSPLNPSKSTFGGGRRSVPGSSAVEETEMTTRPLLQDFDENPLYRPPPPFEPSRNDARSPRPKHANPQQRDPQPYVPP